jgi:predicted nucleotidyltransferase
MNACGLIVEYNPFHNGHVYHIEAAKKTSGADCIVAVMSGNFLQRGEPAIIDKYSRTRAALQSGVDLVIELPYLYAVQNSDIFARGAVSILHEAGVSTICFGSESGEISNFKESYRAIQKNKATYETELATRLDEGLSFPEANKYAYRAIGASSGIDLTKPNNILGFSYIKAIYEQMLPVDPLTIKRKNNQFHDTTLTGNIASATSIRKQLLNEKNSLSSIQQTIPEGTEEELQHYQRTAGMWHEWELYFPLLHYRVLTMSEGELREIHGVDEGIEHRIKKFAKEATSMEEWIQLIKTKRYTWTRIQRLFTHILTNTKKQQMASLKQEKSPPYLRILGFTKKGQAFLKSKREDITAPFIFSLKKNAHPLLAADERAVRAYYSVLAPHRRKQLFQQEFSPPIQV